MVFRINRHTGRAFAWRNGPVRDDFMLGRINRHDFVFVFDVHENPRAIRLSELRLAAKWNRGDNLASLRVNDD